LDIFCSTDKNLREMIIDEFDYFCISPPLPKHPVMNFRHPCIPTVGNSNFELDYVSDSYVVIPIGNSLEVWNLDTLTPTVVKFDCTYLSKLKYDVAKNRIYICYPKGGKYRISIFRLDFPEREEIIETEYSVGNYHHSCYSGWIMFPPRSNSQKLGTFFVDVENGNVVNLSGRYYWAGRNLARDGMEVREISTQLVKGVYKIDPPLHGALSYICRYPILFAKESTTCSVFGGPDTNYSRFFSFNSTPDYPAHSMSNEYAGIASQDSVSIIRLGGHVPQLIGAVPMTSNKWKVCGNYLVIQHAEKIEVISLNNMNTAYNEL
jgi:hypothetical protein